jgi:glycosyltransferase involved in cell wall biosynthesis
MAGPRIAIVAPFVPVRTASEGDRVTMGGVERYVTENAKELGKLGFDVTLVTPSDSRRSLLTDGLSIQYFRGWGPVFGTPLFNPLRLLQVLKGFDLVHAMGTYPLISDLNPVLARLRGVPSVITYHFEPTLASPLGMLAGRLYAMTLARMIREHDRIIVPMRSYRQNTKLLKDGWDEKIRYIPEGIGTEFFVPDPSVSVEKRFLFVGRLVPYKDLPLLLKAMAVVNKTLPDHELLIVGKGPLEEPLKREAASTGANARFLGRVDDQRLLGLYRSSVATILPSHDHQEAFGMTLGESMSCGTPVIAADIPGVREVASIGGTLVDPGSPEALAKAMLDVASVRPTPAQRRKLHESIDKMFSWRSVAERTAAVYRELL